VENYLWLLDRDRLFTYFVTVNACIVSGLALVGVAVAYLILSCVWLLVWQPAVQGANREDKKWKHYYMHRAEGRPVDCSAKDPWHDELTISAWHQWKEDMKELKRSGIIVEVAATFVFLAVSFIVILANYTRVSVRIIRM